MQNQSNKTLHVSALLLFIGMPILYVVPGLTSALRVSNSIHIALVDTELVLFILGVILFGLDNYKRSGSVTKAVLKTGLLTGLILLVVFIAFWMVAFSAV